MFRIDFDHSKKFKKDWQKLNNDFKRKKKIKFYLEKLAQNPFYKFLDIKKLKPNEINKFRLRVDYYRVIYSMDFWNKVIIIHRIGLRSEIYK